MASLEREIFKDGSTTYYWSSKFFPKGARDDVFKLYSFVRVVDDFVDTTPQEKDRFFAMRRRWETVKKQLKKNELPGALDDSVDERVLANIAYVVHRFNCDPAWVDAFLDAMEKDLNTSEYKTLDDVIEYIYGSAEVIGLFMARVLRLPGQGKALTSPEPDVFLYARMQGRAMQWINFCRDIAEDNELGRCYFPKRTLKQFGLKDLSEKTAHEHKDSFKAFMHEQINLYEEWQHEANKGFSYIPKRMLVPLKTAVDMYNWTAEEIKKDPFIVYSKKVKPTKKRIVSTIAKNSVR